MAYIDVQNLFSDEQAVTVTAIGSNQIDVGAMTPKRNIGRANGRIVFTVDEAATAAGAATVTFEVVEADDATLTTNATVLAASAAIGKAALTQGAKPFSVALPDTTRKYIGVRYTVATGPLTAGKFTAAYVLDDDHNRSYASAYPSPYSS